MDDMLVRDLGGRSFGIVFGLVMGTGVTAVLARWRRLRERRLVLAGDARDSVVIEQHIIETDPGSGAATAMRVRSLGQGHLQTVVPNGHLARSLSHRARRVTALDTLISMEGAEGSYLLETLSNFVCDRVGNEAFDHDLYVMAPCREPAGLTQYQPIAVVLIRVADLELFADWDSCVGVNVEHGSDGARLLTLHTLAKQFQSEREGIATLREAGQSTRYAETAFVLDLALDTRVAPVPTRAVPWARFTAELALLGLAAPDDKRKFKPHTLPRRGST